VAGRLPVALVRGINSNTLTILIERSANAVTCGNAEAFWTLPPSRSRRQPPATESPSSLANIDDGHQTVALPRGRCSSANIRSYTAADRATPAMTGRPVQPARSPRMPLGRRRTLRNRRSASQSA
jgi:hypothetical protein